MEEKEIKPASLSKFTQKIINRNWNDWFFGENQTKPKQQEQSSDQKMD